MASFATLHGLHGSLLRSQFLGQDHHLTHHFPPKHPSHHSKPNYELQPHAKFNIVEIMGGRGICNGEKGLQQELERGICNGEKDLQQELERQVESQQPPQPQPASGKEQQENSGGSVAVPEDAFEKEMMGLTGGFPGGEKGLQKFIEENPPSKPGTVLTLSL